LKITKIIVEFDVSSGEGSIRELRDFLGAYLSEHNRMEDSPAPGEEPVANSADHEQVRRLRRLAEGLTEKQVQVWRVFVDNPGPIAASRLKTVLPELRQPGALPGVFRAAHRWVTQLGGEKSECPFAQIRWTGSEGVYRGLTPAEVEALR